MGPCVLWMPAIVSLTELHVPKRLFHVPARTHQDGFFLYEFAFPSSNDDGCQAIPQNIDPRSSHVHQLIDSEDDKYWFYRQMK